MADPEFNIPTISIQKKIMYRYYPLFLLGLLLVITVATSDSTPDDLLASTKSTDGNEDDGLTHIRFFWHDTVGGPDPSTVDVAESPTTNLSATLFGLIRVLDDPMTIEPNRSSELLGKSQGIYVSADQKVPGLLLAITFNFMAGEYNGSSFSILGRDVVSDVVREMPIVGGTGLFRFITGYVVATTQYHDPTIGYFIVEFNCYIKLKN